MSKSSISAGWFACSPNHTFPHLLLWLKWTIFCLSNRNFWLLWISCNHCIWCLCAWDTFDGLLWWGCDMGGQEQSNKHHQPGLVQSIWDCPDNILVCKQERRDLTAGPLGWWVTAFKITLKGLWSAVQISKGRTVVSGVPQRLVLGPEQFNIFVSARHRGGGEFLGM